MPRDEPPFPPVDTRFGYLLKHARERLALGTKAALEPYGITGRELAVLTVVSGDRALSQLEAARRLGVDRTTMVALLDGLQAKGLVQRRAHVADRRVNLVELTPIGRDTLVDASRAADAAEAAFLAPLGDADRAMLRELLRSVVLNRQEDVRESDRTT